MSAPLLAEGTVILIRDYIRSNIDTALATVSAARSDKAVGMDSFRSYFIYNSAKGYQVPACFVVCEDFDHQPSEGQNFIYAKARIIVSIVLEDQREEDLTLRVWRYQSALFDLLNLRDIVDGTSRLKLHVIIKRQLFSEMFLRKAEMDETDTVFRKEAIFELDVVHQEQV